MHINATLLGQMITFAIFVWFTMRIIWPLLSTQLNERKKRIADGLAAAERGQKILLEAEEKAKVKIQEARQHCYKILEEADIKASEILAQVRVQAQKERDEILATGHSQVLRELRQAKSELQKQIANIVILGAEKILQRSINPDDHQDILQGLAKKLA
jgi:F-type H+-transporting ATPase subunit b